MLAFRPWKAPSTVKLDRPSPSLAPSGSMGGADMQRIRIRCGFQLHLYFWLAAVLGKLCLSSLSLSFLICKIRS